MVKAVNIQVTEKTWGESSGVTEYGGAGQTGCGGTKSKVARAESGCREDPDIITRNRGQAGPYCVGTEGVKFNRW